MLQKTALPLKGDVEGVDTYEVLLRPQNSIEFSSALSMINCQCYITCTVQTEREKYFNS
jgi:sRNA-binding regulator protein Hfq